MIFVLTMRQEETLQTSEVSFMDTLLSHQVLLFMLGGFGLLVTCLAWGLVLKPGILAKVNLANSGNVVTKICQEMEAPGTEEELTPLDEVCLVCLTEKYMHLEHCSATNRCVRNFHVHSDFFNKSFGDANIRPFMLFYMISLG